MNKSIMIICLLTIGTIGGLKLFSGHNSPTKGYSTAIPQDDITQKENSLNQNRGPASDDIVFKYLYKGDDLKLTLKNMSWEKAHKEATMKCMDYYKDKHPMAFEKAVKGDEDEYLSMIDVCANPREGNKPVTYDW